MFPETAADINRLDTKTSEVAGDDVLGRVHVFDFADNKHTIVDGRMVDCTSDEAIMQWIELVLQTEPNTYGVYTVDEPEVFGVHTRKYIGLRNYPLGFVSAELKREVTEQLTAGRFITGIEDFSAVKEDRGLRVNFTAVLSTGSRLTKELVIGGL